MSSETITRESGVITIPQIKIDPRQRHEYPPEAIDDLANSIKEFGLLNPIILHKADNSLVAGMCRILAHQKLGRQEIEFRYFEDLDPIRHKEMELEENLRRKQLEWWEWSAAIAEIHELRQTRDPNWSMRQTAEYVGKSLGTVQQSVDLKKEMKRNPRIRQEKNLTGALRKVKIKKQLVERKKAIERKNAGLTPSIPAEILVGDARELIKLESDDEYDAIVTNLPFGVELEFKSGEAPYEDEESHIIHLVQDVVKEGFRVLKPDSWFVAFFDIRKITYSDTQLRAFRAFMDLIERSEGSKVITRNTADELVQLAFDSMGLAHWFKDAGFNYVTLVPCVWVKPNKSQGMIGDPSKTTIVAYEAFVFASKGNAILLKQGRQNIFVFETLNPSERLFSVQMNKQVCKAILEMVVLGGASVLDPFAGVGSFGEAALDLQCSFRGYEINKSRASTGNMLLMEHQHAAASKEPEK